MSMQVPPPFRFAHLRRLHWDVSHGITARSTAMPAYGDTSYVTGQDPKAVLANRKSWSDSIGADAARWVCAQQVHGSVCAVVAEADAGRGADSFGSAIPGTDALVTATPGLPLAVFCADCVPVLLYDPVRRVVAAAHAGWRGTVGMVVVEVVRTMQDRFGCRPEDLLAGIGPSIGPCCYEVGPEVLAAWWATGLDPSGTAERVVNGGRHFDLWQANRLALLAAGVPDTQIESAELCTCCAPDVFFSHRSRQDPPGRMAAVIMLRPEGTSGLPSTT